MIINVQNLIANVIHQRQNHLEPNRSSVFGFSGARMSTGTVIGASSHLFASTGMLQFLFLRT